MSARTIPASAYLPLIEAHATAMRPEPIFHAVEGFCREYFGFGLLTILRHLPDTGEIERVYSTNLDVYPAGARKPMGGTPWGRVVLERGEVWLGNGPDDIRWAYPDAELTLSMGRETSFCVPVRIAGRTIGLLNMSAERDRYDFDDSDHLKIVAALLVWPLLM